MFLFILSLSSSEIKKNYELIIIDPDKNIECWQKEEGREVRK